MIKYQVRALLMVRAFRETALYPAPLDGLHVVTYLTDALANVWKIRALDGAVLKTGRVPRSRGMQAAIDSLVGIGLLVPSDLHYVVQDGRHALHAAFSLNEEFSDRVLSVVDAHPESSAENTAIREISFAVAAFGNQRLPMAVLRDATYSDPLIDINSVLDLVPSAGGRATRTAQAGRSLDEIVRKKIGHSLTAAELTGLYVRHVFSLVGEGAAS